MAQTASSYQSGRLTGKYWLLLLLRRERGTSLLQPSLEGLVPVRYRTAPMRGEIMCYMIQVQFRVFKETVGPLKESAVWVQEKYHPRRFVVHNLYCIVSLV